MKVFTLFSFLFSIHALAQGPTRGRAYVYFGPGSCEEEVYADGTVHNDQCSTAAMKMATLAGYTPVAVHGDELSEKSTPEEIKMFFGRDVKVWIQPGGVSNVAYQHLSPAMVKALKKFIFLGGGYVGWCAGAYMATVHDGDSLNIFPRESIFRLSREKNPRYLHEDRYSDGTTTFINTISLEKVLWGRKFRRIYLEGGGALHITPKSEAFARQNPKVFGRVDVVARFPDLKVAAARTTYGKGRVFLTGLHPEAPAWWSTSSKLTDPDGVDDKIAAEMIQWAGGAIR